MSKAPSKDQEKAGKNQEEKPKDNPPEEKPQEEEKNKGGRPKAPMILTERQLAEILERYREGASDAEVKAYIYEIRGSFSNDLWYRWIEEDPEFSECIRLGKLLSEAWWTKQGRENLFKRDFNGHLYKLNMIHKFGWTSDKQQLDHTHNTPPVQITLPDNGREADQTPTETN